MNQLNMFLCFVLLYLSLLGGVGCCSNKNISHLNRTLSYSFEGFSCVQMFSPDDLPWQYYKVLPALGVPVVINQSNKYCYGFVLFAIDTIHLKKMLINIKKYYNHRIVCYLQYEDSLLNSFVKNETYLFGESEALITDGYRTYKFDELEKIFYEINLIGEEETWGKQRRIMNFKGREVTVAGFNVSMFTSFGQVDEKGHPAWFKGIDLYVLWRLTSLMNITWKALISKDRWGMKLPNGTWTPGVFRAVLDGKADIGVGSIWMTIEKYESMPLTAPTSMVYLRHLIRRPAASNAIWNSFFKHYPPSVWALLLVAAFINVLAISLITYCINRIRNDIAHKKWSFISTCSLMTFGAISVDARLPSHKNPEPVRLLLSCWAITTFIFMTNFGSSLISQLTTPDLHHRPGTIRGFVEGGYFWGLTYTPNFEQLLDLSNPWHEKWARRFVLIKNKEHYLRLLNEDKFILWGKAVGETYFVMIEDYWTSDLLSGFELGNEKLAMFYITFALTPGSQLLPAMDKYCRRIIETGHIGRHLEKVLMEEEGDPYMAEVMVKTKQPAIGYSSLALNHFQSVFYILFIGLSIATILFISEIGYNKNKIN